MAWRGAGWEFNRGPRLRTMANEIMTLTQPGSALRWKQVREVLRDALVNFSREKSSLVSASIAYYSLLAVFPMLLLLLSASGIFIQRFELSGRLALVLGHYLPFRADFIMSNLVGIRAVMARPASCRFCCCSGLLPASFCPWSRP